VPFIIPKEEEKGREGKATCVKKRICQLEKKTDMFLKYRKRKKPACSDM
jgi:hypothetical protein